MSKCFRVLGASVTFWSCRALPGLAYEVSLSLHANFNQRTPSIFHRQHRYELLEVQPQSDYFEHEFTPRGAAD